MTNSKIEPFDWDCVDLVTFDVDGTLYSQSALRCRMLLELAPHLLYTRNFRTLSIIRSYRRLRERFGDEEVSDFEPKLVSEVASSVGCSQSSVEAVVAEWIEQRPLRHLAGCRYPGLGELFVALRRSGKIIGILSDYPAHRKLQALGLDADAIVCAGDEGVGRLKPHPHGFKTLIGRMGVSAARAVLIGDRIDRDGLVARRIGAKCLIRSRRPEVGWATFRRYDEQLFAPILKA
ncbi:HAD family hydrolase [Bradyrhizobium centrosematis]|uniref:HAD family hydrolase n=1 Tax=Bradyrhizobium centrosematis TaxID=1300039 RepID=UPI00388F7699